MTDNPWTAEVHMEAGTNGTDHAVWLYERQTYIAKPVHGSIEKCERFAARINGTNQPTADALAKAERCLIASETREPDHLDDLAAANVDPQSRRLKEIIDHRRSELAVLLAPQPTHTVRPDLLDGTNLIRHWLVGRTVDSVGLAAELRQWADLFAPQPTDLPDGVSPWLGDEADAVALPAVACELDDDEWEWQSPSALDWKPPSHLNQCYDGPVLLRRKPQTVTVELPTDATDEQIIAACREVMGR